MTKRIVYQYRDKASGRIINSDDIIADNKNGIVENIDGMSFRFIPRERLVTEPVAANYGYDYADAPSIPSNPDASPYDKTVPNEKSKWLGEYYNYAFGIDKIKLGKTKPKAVSGFISDTINIGTCECIELDIKTSGGNASVETYIIDGVDETPILPIKEEKVVHEKLFHGLSTRFLPDKNKPIEIFKNGEKASFDYSNITNDGNIYTISYTPVVKSHRYVPMNKSVRVKVIQRYDLPNMLPTTIESITLLKYGGTKIWNT